MSSGKYERFLGFRICYLLAQIGFYTSLLLTGLLIGSFFPFGDRSGNIAIYNTIEIDRRLGESHDVKVTEKRQHDRHLLVKILCFIITSPTFLWTRAIHVQKTWGRRCDKTLYFSSETNASFPAIGLNVSEGREHLTAKSHLAFRYIYENHLNEFDWFLKADDNTYVVVENLKYFLSSKDPQSPTFYGHHFLSIIEGGYASGGAGYVLGKEAVKRLVEHGDNAVLCRQDGGSEDVEIGKCLHNIGVPIGDSYDPEGRSLFHCFDPATHLFGDFPSWYQKFDAAGALKGQKTMGREVISFHYVKPSAMYVYDYFLYQVRVRGLDTGV